MALEDLINSINDEGERGQLKSLLGKYGNVKTALEVGEQAAPVFEKVRALNVDPAKELALLPSWVDWRNKETDPATGKLKAVIAAESERDVLKGRVAELEAKGETEMTTEEVKALADARFDERMKAMVEDPSNPLIRKDVLLGSMNSQAQRFQEIYAALTPEAVSHSQKYGEPLPVQEVLDYIEKHGERDPKKAYQAILEPRDTKLKIAQLEADAQKKFEEGKLKGIEEAQAKVNGQRMPVDGGGNQGTRGNHFMNKIFKRREASASAGNTRLGSGSAAQAGMADYQKKLMGSGSV